MIRRMAASASLVRHPVAGQHHSRRLPPLVVRNETFRQGVEAGHAEHAAVLGSDLQLESLQDRALEAAHCERGDALKCSKNWLFRFSHVAPTLTKADLVA